MCNISLIITQIIECKRCNFTWEQRKLGELVTPVIREVPKPDKPYERLSVRSHAKGTFHQWVDDPTKVAMDKLFVVKENDLVVNITFAWEHAIAVAKKEDDGMLVSHRFPTFVIDKSDINFIKYSVSQEFFRRKMELISPGGAGRNRVLSKKEFPNLTIPTPINLEEQQKIGSFFKTLDDTIALHQKKLSLLRETKKAFLKQFFPVHQEKNVDEEGSKIRFTDFEDKWEQRKLGEIVDVRSGRDYKHLDKGEIPVYGTGGYMLSVNAALSTKEDAIGIGRKGTIDKPYLLQAPFWTVDTLFYAIPKQGNDLNFVNNVFQRVNWKKYDESTGVPSLSKKSINNVIVVVPSIKEQVKIGKFFKRLDNLIVLHQRKLTQLQTLKKAYLQKMFI